MFLLFLLRKIKKNSLYRLKKNYLVAVFDMCACGNRSIGVSGHAIGIGTISTVADEVCTERSDSVSNQTNSLKMFGSFLSCVNVNFESAAYYVIFHL